MKAPFLSVLDSMDFVNERHFISLLVIKCQYVWIKVKRKNAGEWINLIPGIFFGSGCALVAEELSGQ